MKTIGIVLKKELKRYFTDIRMLIGIILPGFLIFALYSVMGNFMSQNQNSITSFNIYVVNEPVELKTMLSFPNYELSVNKEDLTKEEILTKIENKEIDLYVVYPQNFYNDMLNYSSSSGNKAPNIDMYYNSASDSSVAIYQAYSTILMAFESELANKFDINNSSAKYDLAKTEDFTVKIFTMMLPFLLTIFLFSGAMGICAESISGEKERGTIATLLVTPAKRSQIAIGKVLALGITSLSSAIVSFIGLIASLPNLVGGNISISAYNPITFVLLLAVIVLTVLIFTVVLTMVSTYAKSVKEASSYSIPVMIVVMLLGATSFMGTTAQTNPALYLIPVYSSIQSLTGILSMNLNPLCFVLFIVSNILYIILGVFGLTKMFNSEKVMFNS